MYNEMNMLYDTIHTHKDANNMMWWLNSLLRALLLYLSLAAVWYRPFSKGFSNKTAQCLTP